MRWMRAPHFATSVSPGSPLHWKHANGSVKGMQTPPCCPGGGGLAGGLGGGGRGGRGLGGSGGGEDGDGGCGGGGGAGQYAVAPEIMFHTTRPAHGWPGEQLPVMLWAPTATAVNVPYEQSGMFRPFCPHR